jgi:hypothetical protein
VSHLVWQQSYGQQAKLQILAVCLLLRELPTQSQLKSVANKKHEVKFIVSHARGKNWPILQRQQTGRHSAGTKGVVDVVQHI